jgi:serine/threonine-protein kinase
MPIASVANLIEELRELDLLSPEQVEALPPIAEAGDLKAVARDLVRRGWFTAYQINQLVHGRGRELFLGPYVFLERLGEGGMGQVFKARHRELARIDAVKVIRKDRLSTPHSLRRFQREVAATTRLDHPNIVRALEAGQAGETWYFAMEYVAGTDLARRLAASGPLPIAEACDYIRQAALGLQHAHEKGLVHRDLKPHNLIVVPPVDGGPFGLLKVLDMGLALITYSEEEALTALTQQGLVMGTADYMAPEQAQNAHAVDIRADLYSLGCTLYHLLTGGAPFPGGTMLEKLMRHRLGEPVLLEMQRPDVPSGVAGVVRCLMAKAPADRIQTPAELVAVLSDQRTYADGPPGHAAAAAPAVMAEPLVEVAPLTESKLTSRPANRKTTVFGPFPVEVQPLPATELEPSPPAPRRRLPRWLPIALAAFGVLIILGILAAVQRPSGRQDPPSSLAVKPPAEPPGAPPAEPPGEAAQAWAALQSLRGEDLRLALLKFRITHPATPQRAMATAWLGRLPSPLDALDPAADPVIRAMPNRPPGLVRVLAAPGKQRTQPVRCVAFSQDGRELVTGHDGEVIVWDLLEGTPSRRLPFQGGEVRRLATSADGQSMAAGGSNGKVQVYKYRGGTRAFGTGTHPILALVFHPTEETLAAADEHGKLCLWNPRDTGRPLAVLFDGGFDTRLLSLAWSPDGRLLVAGGADHKLRAWQVPNPTPAWTDEGHKAWVFAVAFTPDGRSLISGGGGDGTLAISRLTDAGPMKERLLGGESSVVPALSPLPDSSGVFIAHHSGALVLRRLGDGEVLGRWQLPGELRDLSVSSDGRHIAVPLDNGQVWVLRLPPRP